MESTERSATMPPGGGRGRAAHLGPERRRPLVLDAALRLFVEHGYRGTSMEAIAAAAGVTKPVVYDCYPSKEELFRALLEREERRLLDEIAGALPAKLDDEIEAALAAALSAIFSAALAAPDSWRVLFDSEHGTEPLVARRVLRGRQSVVARLVTLVEPALLAAGVEQAERKAPVLADLQISVGEAGVRMLLAPDNDWSAKELSALLARVAVGGFAAA